MPEARQNILSGYRIEFLPGFRKVFPGESAYQCGVDIVDKLSKVGDGFFLLFISPLRFRNAVGRMYLQALSQQ